LQEKMMFTLAKKERPYVTYVLGDEETSTQIEVVPERGGILTRWQVAGKEIFYMDEERYKDPTLTVRGGNPILFPICGNLVDNQYTYQDTRYTLKQHGFARDLPWTVTSESTTDGAALTITLTETPATLAVYPFAFTVAITYRLVGSTVTIAQTITNHSTEAMPFAIGFHPYFAVQDKEQLNITIPSTATRDQKTKQLLPFDGSFDFQRDEIDSAFSTLTAPTAEILDPVQGTRLTVSYDESFSNLVFWTVKGKDFYCLEPWTSGRNALNTGENLITLAPGESKTLQVHYTVTLL
jgi:galactose mutarotase-like enzyme